MTSHNFQIPGSRLVVPPTREIFPVRYRIPLKRSFSGGSLFRRTEEKTSGLSAGFRIDFENTVAFPTDSDTSWHTHDGWSAVRFALFTSGFIFAGIPGIRYFAPFSGNGNGFVVTFFGSDHSNAPIFGD